MEKRMKSFSLLAVGNSFTQDALYYLHDICLAAGIESRVVNLYIGGCSLKRHWNNLVTGAEEYLYEVNGVSAEKYVSVNKALCEQTWDFILTQQASHDSGMEETYFPYLTYLLGAFREACPEAECLLQKTWAYETDSTHGEFPRYHNNQQEMYERLSACYEEAARRERVRLIPSADVIQRVRRQSPFRYELGEKSLCRDGFHMDLIYGRYLLGGLIYTFLTGNDIRENTFMPKEAEPEGIKVIQECVQTIV